MVFVPTKWGLSAKVSIGDGPTIRGHCLLQRIMDHGSSGYMYIPRPSISKKKTLRAFPVWHYAHFQNSAHLQMGIYAQCPGHSAQCPGLYAHSCHSTLHAWEFRAISIKSRNEHLFLRNRSSRYAFTSRHVNSRFRGPSLLASCSARSWARWA